MTDGGEFDLAEVGSLSSGEDPDRSQAGWISGLQWGPWEGMRTAKGAGLAEEVGTPAQTLPAASQTYIV